MIKMVVEGIPSGGREDVLECRNWKPVTANKVKIY